MSTSSPPRRRKPRADAERNRTRVLEAARALFTARGEDVQMPEVARAAGVGIGTVYRHFPSRAALIEAAGEQRHAEIVTFGRTRCVPCPDAADGLARYLWHIGEVLATDRGLTASIEATLGSARPKGTAAERTEAIAAELIARARAQGTIRPDIEVIDLSMIVCGLAAVIRNGTGDWRRYLAITLAGLGDAAAGPLSDAVRARPVVRDAAPPAEGAPDAPSAEVPAAGTPSAPAAPSDPAKARAADDTR
ncbi:TetR family transcriptional regulator [Streptomyces sp. 796.1]|uniref:TetR/AcrR family transcriptional regulator n=1 Tax=Streptomyces sp. 796.1 TaxID=3163029 RepID=UPI0039C8CD23